MSTAAAAYTDVDVDVAARFTELPVAGRGILLLITGLGSAPLAWIVSTVVAAASVRGRQWRTALFIVLAVGGVGLLNSALKSLYHQPRPDLGLLAPEFDGFGFPSGHAMTATVLYSSLASIWLRREPSAEVRAAVVGVAIAAIAIVGCTRLMLRAHYLSDVLGGIGFGLLWFAATRAVLAPDDDPTRAHITDSVLPN
jgi:undecaprenyl-diphosphatase